MGGKDKFFAVFLVGEGGNQLVVTIQVARGRVRFGRDKGQRSKLPKVFLHAGALVGHHKISVVAGDIQGNRGGASVGSDRKAGYVFSVMEGNQVDDTIFVQIVHRFGVRIV